MIRRLLSSVVDSLQSTDPSIYLNPFSKSETTSLGWLTSVAPCFPVCAKNISIINEPSKFYETLLQNCQNAKKRITLVSLYLGNGEMEKNIVDTLKENDCFRNGILKINILLDYTRGSRSENNSRCMLMPLLLENDRNCTVSLYHTPVLRGLLKKFIPDRWNELLGLQHMKLYIFDDTLLISGANLSNDYFINRQDRYFVIKDKELTDFYSGLVGKVQKFSLKLDQMNQISLHEDWNLWPYKGSKADFVEKAGDIIEEHMLESIIENRRKLEEYDTWIFPTIQMGQLGIEQDSYITGRILEEAPNGSKLKIATGYFNLTDHYMETLIEESQAQCDILMAHPKANGFLGAKGPAGGIPYAYSLLARRFKKQLTNRDQTWRICLLEYLRVGWTYHAKGLWYYPPNSNYPCLTFIGSPNFGERSVKKDLETQLVIVTENDDLRKRLHEECQSIYKLGLPAEIERTCPKWVNGFIWLFRSYF